MSVLAAGGISAGLTGFLVVLGLIVVSVLLFRSMTRHLRKVPPTFDEPRDGPRENGQRPDREPRSSQVRRGQKRDGQES